MYVFYRTLYNAIPRSSRLAKSGHLVPPSYNILALSSRLLIVMYPLFPVEQRIPSLI